MSKLIMHGDVLGVTKCGVQGFCSNYKKVGRWESMENYVDGIYTGYKYQCVEFARRYWLLNHGVVLPDVGIAAQIWRKKHVYALPLESKSVIPLIHYPNGGSTKPKVGDLLIYDVSEEEHAGHVAVVVEILEYLESNHQVVRIAEQNRDNEKIWPGHYSFEMRMIVTNNDNVTTYYLHDHDCPGLFGWTRIATMN